MDGKEHIILICCIILPVFVSGTTYERDNEDLTDIPSGIPADTTDLSLKSNHISTIDTNRIQHLDLLETVDLTANSFTSFPNLCNVGSTLETLVLTSNVGLITFEASYLGCLDVLRELSLQSTGIDFFPDLSLIGAKLATLFLHKNRITGIPENRLPPLTALRYLQLSRNNFATIPDFSPLASTLQKLYLHGNDITIVPDGVFDSLVNLVEINLSDNKITEYPNLCHLSNTLTHIHFGGNDISEINPDYVFCFDSFNQLSIGGPSLHSIDNLDLTKINNTLVYLVIENSPLTSIPYYPNMGLVTDLSIRNNRFLSELPPNYFTGWDSLDRLDIESMKSWGALPSFELIADTLKYLDASDNTFDIISIANIAILRNLQILELRHTSLHFVRSTPSNWLPTTCPYEPEAMDIELSGARLNPCSCDMLWLKNVQSLGGTVKLESGLMCNGLVWVDATLEQLQGQCEQESKGMWQNLNYYHSRCR